MRGLYEIFIVETDAGNVLGPYRVIASDEAKAKLMAVAKHYDVDKVDDADVLVRKIGDVRPKREVQQVKIVP